VLVELGLLEQRHKAVLEVLRTLPPSPMSPVATGWSDKTCMTGCDATPATAWPLCRTEAPSLSDAIRWLFDCRRSCARPVDFVALHSSPFVGPTVDSRLPPWS